MQFRGHSQQEELQTNKKPYAKRHIYRCKILYYRYAKTNTGKYMNIDTVKLWVDAGGRERGCKYKYRQIHEYKYRKVVGSWRREGAGVQIQIQIHKYMNINTGK